MNVSSYFELPPSFQIDAVSLLFWTKLLVERKETAPDDASTAASASAVWSYVRSHPDVPIKEVTATQLLSALSGRPDLVVDVIRALHRGDLSVRANPQHFATALQSLAAAGDVERAKEVYGLIAGQPEFSMYSFAVNAMLSAYGSDVGRYFGDAKALFERAMELKKVSCSCAATRLCFLPPQLFILLLLIILIMS